MITHTKDFKAFAPIGRVASRNAGDLSSNFRKRAARFGEEAIGQISEVDDFAHKSRATADNWDPATGSMVGSVISAAAMASTGGLLANDFGAPAALKGSSAAANIAGKAANKMGATRAANRLTNIGSAISQKHDFLQNTALEELSLGRKFANFSNGVADRFYGLTSGIDKYTSVFTKSSERALASSAKLVGKAEGFASTLGHAPEELKTAIQTYIGTAHADANTLSTAVDAVKKAAENHTLNRQDTKAIEKIKASIAKANILHGKALDAKDLAAGKHSTRDIVKKLSVHEGLSKAFWGASSATSVLVSANETISDMKAFRSFLADMQGKELNEVTSGDALFSELPHAGNIARQALLSAAAPKAILEAVNTVFNIKMIRGSHVNQLLFFAPMAASMGISALTSGNILDVYKEMKSAEAHGKEIPAEQYATLIGMAHKELHKRGGAGSNFAQELGRIYADRHASVRDTLQAIASGQIDKELAAIREHNSQAPVQAEAPAPQLASVSQVAANQNFQRDMNPSLDALTKDAGFAARYKQQQALPQETVR